MELLREIAELMEAAVEIIEAKRKERQQKNKDAKKKLLCKRKAKTYDCVQCKHYTVNVNF